MATTKIDNKKHRSGMKSFPFHSDFWKSRKNKVENSNKFLCETQYLCHLQPTCSSSTQLFSFNFKNKHEHDRDQRIIKKSKGKKLCEYWMSSMRMIKNFIFLFLFRGFIDRVLSRSLTWNFAVNAQQITNPLIIIELFLTSISQKKLWIWHLCDWQDSKSNVIKLKSPVVNK
jgi:hypothetical protein